MDVGRAFTYVTEDPDWVSKVLVGGVIFLVSSLLSFLAIGLVGFMALAGYYLEVIRRVHAGAPTPLPSWDDFGGYISRGFLLFVGALLWAVPLVLVACIAFVIAGVSGSDVGTVFAVAAVCLLIPLAIALNVLILPLVAARYAVSNDFGAMFRFGEIFQEVQRAFVPLLIVWVMAIVVGFLVYLGLVACIIGVFFTFHYGYLVQAYLVGEMYRQAAGNRPAPGAAF